MVGSVNYLVVTTQPDVALHIKLVGRDSNQTAPCIGKTSPEIYRSNNAFQAPVSTRIQISSVERVYGRIMGKRSQYNTTL